VVGGGSLRHRSAKRVRRFADIPAIAARACDRSFMPSPLRDESPGYHHIWCRGNNKRPIVVDDFDRFVLLALIDSIGSQYGWQIAAHCLMDNHYHLVIETPQPNLSIGMRHLNGNYARVFNDRHDRCGHVFQARFRSILIDDGSYFLAACRYVVRNPVRAGICARPDEYRWSSYRDTAGTGSADLPLALDRLLSSFAPTLRLAQASYRRFVDPNAEDDFDVQGERLGSREFLRNTFGHDLPIPEIPRRQIEPFPPTLEELFAAGETPIATAYRRHGYTLNEIASFLGCHYATVSRRLRHEEARTAIDRTPVAVVPRPAAG
jgi:REP-associated tyrosine transposase